jgi:hypothetical protein
MSIFEESRGNAGVFGPRDAKGAHLGGREGNTIRRRPNASVERLNDPCTIAARAMTTAQ